MFVNSVLIVSIIRFPSEALLSPIKTVCGVVPFSEDEAIFVLANVLLVHPQPHPKNGEILNSFLSSVLLFQGTQLDDSINT